MRSHQGGFGGKEATHKSRSREGTQGSVYEWTKFPVPNSIPFPCAGSSDHRLSFARTAGFRLLNMVKQLNTSAFVILLYCASPMVAVAWQAAPLPWSLLLVLGIWLIGCFKLFGLLHIMFPAHRGDNHSTGATTPASPGCVEVMNRAEVAWSGYILMAAPVLAVWAGFINGSGVSFVAFVLLLLGCGFVYLAMLAPSKLTMPFLTAFLCPTSKKNKEAS